MKPIISHWVDKTPLTNEEKLHIAMLRIAGCECELPLLGFHKVESPCELWLPRCRLCNTEANLPKPREANPLREWKLTRIRAIAESLGADQAAVDIADICTAELS